MPCAILHAQVVRDVWVQTPVLFLDWKRCQAFREHGAIALESRVVDFLFYTSYERPLGISDIQQAKRVSKR